jgi:hypothetical protein
MSKREILVNQSRSFASGRDALSFGGYKYLGIATINGKKKEVFEMEDKRVIITSCKIERYKVKNLFIADFEGKTDQEIELETENKTPNQEPGI